LSRLNGSSDGRDPARRRIALALVDLVGEHGLEAVGIEAVCVRAGVRRDHFERCFADLEDCFLTVHDEVAEEFHGRLRAAHGRAVDWHAGVWAAGWSMMRFLQADPVRARFLIAAVNGAGEGAQLRRDRFVQRLADLLDGSAGGSPALAAQSAGPGRRSRCTAEIAAAALYRMVLAKVEAGAIERDEEFLPELIYMAVMPYLGARAAEGELAVQPLH
jgi:AcrR family transcriptional regulator